MRTKSQVNRDKSRVTYRVGYPSDLPSEPVLAWLRSLPSALHQGKGSIYKRDTLAFETWATPSGITHRLIVPKKAAEYTAAQLRTHGRGVTVTQDDTREPVEWTAGISVGMTSPLRPLRIPKHADLSASLLASMQALQGDEKVMLQWVIYPAKLERQPSKATTSSEFSWKRAIIGGPSEASSDEINDRRTKLAEQNLIGIGRIVAKADNPKRADELIRRVKAALDSSGSASNHFAYKVHRKIVDEANDAASVTLFPSQFTVSELAAVIAWPIGSPFVAGVARAGSRQLIATEDVATEGRVLGDSNFAGHERPIALPYEYATRHMVVTGGAGTGKTNFLVSCFAQDVEAGYGAIIIDAGDSESDETMFSGALRYIPRHRMDDVIVVDVTRDRANPVGFNIFEQAAPRTIADQLVRLFQTLYADITGVWLPQLLFHGVYTLAEHGGLTFADLIPLLNPQTDAEKAWSNSVIDAVKDPDVREWWKRWRAMDIAKQTTRLEPLYNRIWQLTSRPEIVNIIGQSSSTFTIKDVIENNKILLINLAGLSEDTAKILGTLFVTSIWTAARRAHPEKDNFLYLDEFQVMTSNLPVSLDDLLSIARKHKLGLAMATQHFHNRIPADVRSSAINNARTKVIFRVSSEEARTWNAEFGNWIENHDFRNLNDYEALVRIASTSGVTDVSLRTRAPRPSLGTEREVRAVSKERFGRPVEDVRAAHQERRKTEETPQTKANRPKVGYDEWKR